MQVEVKEILLAFSSAHTEEIFLIAALKP